jgi:hypothetical protein
MASAMSAIEVETAVISTLVPSALTMVKVGGLSGHSWEAAVTDTWALATEVTLRSIWPGAAPVPAETLTLVALAVAVKRSVEVGFAFAFAREAREATEVLRLWKALTRVWVVLTLPLSSVCGADSTAMSWLIRSVV